MSGTAVPRRLRPVLLSALAAVAVGSAGLAAPATAGPPPAEPGTIPGAWIVTVEDGASPDAVADDHRRDHGAQVDQIYRHALSGYAARMSDGAAADVARDRRVASVERDRLMYTTAQEVPTGINRVDAELSTLADIDGSDERVDVDVAVIDTGIADHPDLDVEGGVDCSEERYQTYSDGNGHGTHVAGTVGAIDNSYGVVGVAPGARLWAVKVLSDSGSGSWSDVICGVDWVTANASVIEVANMSLGADVRVADTSTCTSGALRIAICNSVSAGITYAVAAGNSKKDASKFVPAAYDEVITVSALADFDGVSDGLGKATCRRDKDDTFADFSNYGEDIDLIAPGVCIKSTWFDGALKTISGTSMAAPHVAGGAALYKAANPGADPDSVKSALQGAGNLGWSNADDRDSIKETLLNVDAFDVVVTTTP